MKDLTGVAMIVGYFGLAGLLVWKLFETGHPVWATIIGVILLGGLSYKSTE